MGAVAAVICVLSGHTHPPRLNNAPPHLAKQASLLTAATTMLRQYQHQHQHQLQQPGSLALGSNAATTTRLPQLRLATLGLPVRGCYGACACNCLIMCCLCCGVSLAVRQWCVPVSCLCGRYSQQKTADSNSSRPIAPDRCRSQLIIDPRHITTAWMSQAAAYTMQACACHATTPVRHTLPHDACNSCIASVFLPPCSPSPRVHTPNTNIQTHPHINRQPAAAAAGAVPAQSQAQKVGDAGAADERGSTKRAEGGLVHVAALVGVCIGAASNKQQHRSCRRQCTSNECVHCAY